MRAAVALGSNLGERLANLRLARDEIVKLGGVDGPIVSSAIYETEPVGCEPGALAFLNGVVEFQHDGRVIHLLRQLREIESKLGRPNHHPPNVSRTIDLDLLYHGTDLIETSELRLPHPRLALRRFVLQPLADIRPDLVLPSQFQSVSQLLGQLPELPAVVRSEMQW